MIASDYRIVFSLSVSHSYFENGMCTDLIYIPDPVTEKIMKRFGFDLRFRINGFDLFVNTKQSLENYLGYISSSTGQACFDFLIENTDSRFLTFTNLPVRWLGELCYHSANGVAGMDGRITLNAQLHSEDLVSSMAQVKIAFQDILKNTSAGKPVHYEIQFLSRSTRWQYFVINKSAVNLENAAVVGKSEITFTRVGTTKIQTGEEAVLFSCNDTLIPLTERPGYKFDLVSNDPKNSKSPVQKTASSKTIFKALPHPDPMHMGVVTVDGVEQITSPMYVYV